MGHAVFLRSEAVRQCGRVRTLRKAQRWLSNIGIPFLSVDQGMYVINCLTISFGQEESR